MMKRDETPYMYPQYIVKVLNQLMLKGIQDKGSRLGKQADIVSILYNQSNNFPVTEQAYAMMWNWINGMLAAGCDEWMKQYWNIAHQYYTFKLEYSRNEDDKERFREFHIMVCVLAFYKERYVVLRHFLNFTNTLPAKYPLIPSSFAHIFNVYKILSKKNQEMYLLKYHMLGTYEGAGEENKIEGLLVDYLALLMIRLYAVNDYNVTFSNPLDFPQTGATLEENSYKKDMASVLSDCLDNLSDNRIRACGLTPEWKGDAKRLIEEYIDECDKHAQLLNQDSSVSEEKKKDLKTELEEASRNLSIRLPKTKEQVERQNQCGSTKFVAMQKIELDERLILKKHSFISSNLGETLVNSLNSQLERFYCYQFLLNSAVRTFVIPYKDFDKAMKRLSLSSEYAILAMGVSPYFFDEIEGFRRESNEKISYNACLVHHISSSNENAILIMKKEDVPCYDFRKLKQNEVKGNEKEIEVSRHLFSNIDAIKKDNLLLTVRQGFSVLLPSSLRYVRLKIAYHMESDDMLVAKVGPIKNYV